jgi:hypothetical protein
MKRSVPHRAALRGGDHRNWMRESMSVLDQQAFEAHTARSIEATASGTCGIPAGGCHFFIPPRNHAPHDIEVQPIIDNVYVVKTFGRGQRLEIDFHSRTVSLNGQGVREFQHRIHLAIGPYICSAGGQPHIHHRSQNCPQNRRPLKLFPTILTRNTCHAKTLTRHLPRPSREVKNEIPSTTERLYTCR